MDERRYAEITLPALSLLRQLKNAPADSRVSAGEGSAFSVEYIDELKRLGYAVEGTCAQGLRLTEVPDVVYPWELADGLETVYMGRAFESFSVVGSTNQYAFSWALAGAPHGAVVAADQQLTGRGRFDRPWASPPRKGLYFSVILRPDLPMRQVPLLTLLTGVVVTEAANELDGVDVAIKWPNDVLCAGGKICGILAETKAGREGKPDFVVIGIGLNVNLDQTDFPAGSAGASLKCLHGRTVSRTRFLQRLLRLMEDHYAGFIAYGFDYLKTCWHTCNCTLGREVAVNTNDGGVVVGQALDLNDQGALVVQLPDGSCQAFLAGDVSIGSSGFQ